MKRWLVRGSLGVALLIVVVMFSSWLWMRASLPQLDGKVALDGLIAEVSVERDSLGVATIHAANVADLARATGFVHAQERFFQMDLLRRSAAGEMAALIGADAVAYDRDRRRHGLRAVAQQVLAKAPVRVRRLLEAYAEGVNAGLAALGARPFAYGVLRAEPARWLPEDSVLVVHAMYFDLHDEHASRERFLAALYAHFPAPFVEFLVPPGTAWDAPMMGGAFTPPPVPDASIIDFRNRADAKAPASIAMDELAPGSNNWAVDDTLSATGAPIVANDMHLGHGVPNIWFRLRLKLAGELDVTGVSLPGVPGVIAGSNGHIAWGFTNSYGDWIDLVRLETAGCEDGYRSARGCESFRYLAETIEVAHGEPRRVEFRRTRWGPVIESGSDDGALYALRWTAHDAAATNLALRELARADTVHDALAIAHRAGMPPQNLVVADSAGNIAWTIIGRIPVRANHDGRLPLDSANTDRIWNGWVAPEDYPVLLNPAQGRLWTANARVVDARGLGILGDGGYALGARAKQIRDRLFARDRFDIKDMLGIQLDDEALFLARWHVLLKDLLDADAIAANPPRAELLSALSDWNGHAGVDSAAYRIVRTFRYRVFSLVFDGLTAEVQAKFPGFDFGEFTQSEGPLWQLVTQRPPHLLPPGHDGWRALLLAAADDVQRQLAAHGELEDQTWGRRNTVTVRHPLGGIPVLGALLNAAPRALPGDNHMPRVQGRDFGASERFAVSPGREALGYFHMPGGQSGHPLSPFYLAGHDDWEAGRAAPFLPGPAVHELHLLPTEVNE
ncbi:MAG TPA: penicillin acylase family protein [Gammaproteobacteria bacterium]